MEIIANKRTIIHYSVSLALPCSTNTKKPSKSFRRILRKCVDIWELITRSMIHEKPRSIRLLKCGYENKVLLSRIVFWIKLKITEKGIFKVYFPCNFFAIIRDSHKNYNHVFYKRLLWRLNVDVVLTFWLTQHEKFINIIQKMTDGSRIRPFEA